MTGRWLSADPLPGAVLINVGDLLENLSSGRLVAHRYAIFLCYLDIEI